QKFERSHRIPLNPIRPVGKFVQDPYLFPCGNGDELRLWKTVSQSFCSTTETQNDSLHFDIVISGGGMVGFAAGCALGQSRRLEDRKILVLEKQNERAWSLPEEFSNRVWESCTEALITFEEEEETGEPIAHIVENDVILHALKDRIPDNVELSSTRSSLVWSTTKQNASALMSLKDDDFVDALNNSVWRDEGTQQVIKNLHEQWQNLLRTIVPSSGSSLDAAHRVHPLAGQGVNLGFGDVACLLETLEKAVLLGTDIGNLEVLQKYETLRQRHNVPSMVAIDALYRLYSTDFSPIVLLRSLGLSAVDAFAPVKKKIINHASS
ncbi:Ubiquinone biosynthesis monooxygenase COQ6, mitochondrial, partial [Armadillidium vulgare]